MGTRQSHYAPPGHGARVRPTPPPGRSKRGEQAQARTGNSAHGEVDHTSSEQAERLGNAGLKITSEALTQHLFHHVTTGIAVRSAYTNNYHVHDRMFLYGTCAPDLSRSLQKKKKTRVLITHSLELKADAFVIF